MISISRLANAVQPSATLAAGAKARQLRANGVTVHDFSLGEPDFTTPEHINAAAVAALKAGHTHYTPAGGTAELRKVIAGWYARTYGLACTPEQVLVSNGAKHSIHNALAAVCDPGDEVIIPTPYWVSYSDLVTMTGATPVFVETTLASGFKATAEQIRSAITPRTRLLMLNSPCNPTGAVYSRGELEAIADVILPTKVAVLSDEIYEQLCFGDARPTCFATLRPELPARTITVSGASKSYAMTGWRMGWSIAPVAVTAAMNNIQSQEAGCPNSISQQALITALEGPQACVATMRDEFQARRDLVCERLRQLPGIRFNVPDGAFYIFFEVSAHFGQTFGGVSVRNSADFCRAALEQAHVNLVPGSAFGAEGFARLSFTTSRAELEAGMRAFGEWLRNSGR